MIGFRIEARTHQPLDSEVLNQFRTVGAAQISDCMARLYGVVGLRAFHDMSTGARMVGQALTVKTRAGDNLMIHKAMSLAERGDILVVDGAGVQDNALIGELMAMDAQNKGIAGFVIEGSIRDKDYFAKNAFPCFARGVSHKGPYKDGPGEIGVPIAVGGQVVNPGDVVVGDADGLVVVPLQLAKEVLTAALKKEQAENGIKEQILSGAYVKPWVDDIIQARRGKV